MMERILKRIQEFFSIDAMIDAVVNSIPNIIVAFITLIVLIVVWRLIKLLLHSLYRKMTLDKTLQNMITNIIKTVLFFAGLIAILGVFGINISVMLASIGIVGITLGFAAQDALSNIIAGAFIFWDKPFVIGDLIEINGHYGRVQVITMRSTRLITVDGKMLSIPNNELINSTVASYTNFPNLRLDIQFTVGSNEPLNKIRDLLFRIVEDDEAYLMKPKPEVVLNAMNDYNNELIFRVWIKNEKEHIIKSDYLREKVFEILTQEQVNLPYETININVNKDNLK